MNALLLETVGGAEAGNAAGSSIRFDARARSREFLRRGLLLSGAIHAVLLFAFLHLHGGGDDAIVRSYGRAVELFREPLPTVIPLPPVPSGAPSTAASRSGTVVPVDPKTFRMPFDFRGIGAFELPRSAPTGGSSQGSGDPAPPAPAPDPNQVFVITDVDVQPVAIEAPKPLYPEFARDAGITGRVVTQVLVKADGTVGRVRVISGIKILADAAQEGLYRWRFRPAMAHGRPVAVWVEIPVNFTL
ncbi:MAG TPA: energy transducer TonB [Candidatus Omnitrophota bacterium]|jgi:protein TonB|nr:energy transducer TonB [Candidatus Omnitrophota bacterium]